MEQKKITNVGELIEELQKYDNSTPVLAVVNGGGYCIDAVGVEDGWTDNEGENTLCIYIEVIYQLI